MSEVEAHLHALLLIELLTAIAADEDDLAGDDERQVPVTAAA